MSDLRPAVQRALSAWDTTTLKPNGDGMLSEAMESLRADFDAAARSIEGAPLPPLPMHPEPHTYTWTALEARAIEQYGKDCARAALASKTEWRCPETGRTCTPEDCDAAPAEAHGEFPAPDLRGIDGATLSEWRTLGLPAKAVLVQEKDLPKIIERACLAYAAAQPQPKHTPDHLELFKEAGEWAEAMKRKITPDMIELLGWLTGAASAWAEKVATDKESLTVAQAPAPVAKPYGYHYTTKAGTTIFHQVGSCNEKLLAEDMQAAIDFPTGHKCIPVYTVPPAPAQAPAVKDERPTKPGWYVVLPPDFDKPTVRAFGKDDQWWIPLGKGNGDDGWMTGREYQNWVGPIADIDDRQPFLPEGQPPVQHPAAPDPAALEAVLKALRAARDCIQIDRTSLADTYMNPVTNRVDDPDGLAGLAEYDEVLAQLDAAVALVAGQPSDR